MLTTDGGVLHNNIKQEHNEVLTPTLLNVLVTIWLYIINPVLPAMIKQRFSTQLRSCTLFTIREEVSEAIPVLLSELEDKESSINRTGSFQKTKPKRKSFSNSRRNCCLCKAEGRQANHFLSACPYLPAEDRQYMSKTRELTTHTEDEDSDEDKISESLSNQMTMVPFRKIDCDSHTHDINIRRVDVFSSPVLEVSINSKISKWTLDSGAEANVITIEECNRLGIEIKPTTQCATQGDGKTPLPT